MPRVEQHTVVSSDVRRSSIGGDLGQEACKAVAEAFRALFNLPTIVSVYTKALYWL
jgi:hypothetical protein